MREKFHNSIPKERLTQLTRRSDHPTTFRFLAMVILFLASGYFAVVSWNGPISLIILSQLCFGVMCCSSFACLHETGHGTAFNSKLKNRLAAFICGIFHVYPSVAFRELHFTHHRYTHIPGKDPEISIGNKPMPSVISSLPNYLAWLTGLPLLLFKVVMSFFGILGMPEIIRMHMYPFIRPKVRLNLALDSLVVLGVYVTIIYLAINVNHGFWALIVGQVVGHSLLSSYLAMEHNGLPHDGDILDRTRSIRTGKFIKLVMWNMPYHAEHHAYPAVPFHSLPDLHEEMIQDLRHKTLDHPQFHMAVVKRDFEKLQE